MVGLVSSDSSERLEPRKRILVLGVPFANAAYALEVLAEATGEPAIRQPLADGDTTWVTRVSLTHGGLNLQFTAAHAPLFLASVTLDRLVSNADALVMMFSVAKNVLAKGLEYSRAARDTQARLGIELPTGYIVNDYWSPRLRTIATIEPEVIASALGFPSIEQTCVCRDVHCGRRVPGARRLVHLGVSLCRDGIECVSGP